MKNTLGHHSVITFVWLLTLCIVLLSGCETVEAPNLPVVGSTSVSAVTESTVDCVGSVTSDGGSPITTRGFCWSTKTNPTLDDDLLADSSGLGTFQLVIAELESGTTYYVRAFATNLAGTTYGEQVTFKTKICSLTTTTPYFIMATTAISGGFLTTDFDSTSVLAKGVCWNTFPNPTLSDSLTIDKLGKGGYTSNMLNLKPLTTYYVRSYVTTSTGVTYGNELNFTTQSGIIGLVTEPVKNITAVSATFSGQLSGDGGAVVTECGFVWGTSAQPTTSDHKMRSETISEKFSCNVSDLTPNLTYYLRTYATNAAGTSYGSEQSFVTLATLPFVTTTVATQVTSSSATTGGLVTSDGSALITARGICWSIYGDPQNYPFTQTLDGTGAGSFISTLTNLNYGMNYWVRAYATNSAGTAYGNLISFLTEPILASVTTNEATNITAFTASISGKVNNGGGSSLVTRGICWGVSPNPTINDSKIENGYGLGTFNISMTGLVQGTTYHARAYATNAVGTYYGNEITFTTLPSTGTVSDIDGNVYNFITIGTQTWMVENLKTTKYRNGELIGTTTPATKDITSESSPKYQWAYDGNEGNVSKYGRLYTWYTLSDSRNIAPAGWHVAMDAEWTSLENYLIANGYNYDGTTTGNKIAKSLAAKTDWPTATDAGMVGNDPSKNNTSGFTGLPGGYRNYIGTFDYLGISVSWWSFTENATSNDWFRTFSFNINTEYRFPLDKRSGVSVRCVRD